MTPNQTTSLQWGFAHSRHTWGRSVRGVPVTWVDTCPPGQGGHTQSPAPRGAPCRRVTPGLVARPRDGMKSPTLGMKSPTLGMKSPFPGMDWEHVCASWESSTGIAEFWLNGKPWPRKGLQRGYTVGATAAILLGQDFGGGFDLYNSFSGELTDVYLWDTGLSPDKMRAAFLSLRLPPALLAWNSLSYEVKGDVVVKPRLREVLGA
uniref:Pentraxin family member n=1 Tax=Serinus canaria TaxID=9135 RepID=A0A8C9L2Z8_SERCA